MLLAIVASASAAERNFIVTSFDKIEVSGPFVVTLIAGTGASARASGSSEALDEILIDVQNQTLRIRPKRLNWGERGRLERGPVRVNVIAPLLRSASLVGSGTLSVDRMRAQQVRVYLSGGGSLSVTQVDTDRLFADLAGAGRLALAGRAAIAKISSGGSGQIEAGGLRVADLDLRAGGSGSSAIMATRSATILNLGAGDVTITGKPACTVNAAGTGRVECGR